MIILINTITQRKECFLKNYGEGFRKNISGVKTKIFFGMSALNPHSYMKDILIKLF